MCTVFHKHTRKEDCGGTNYIGFEWRPGTCPWAEKSTGIRQGLLTFLAVSESSIALARLNLTF